MIPHNDDGESIWAGKRVPDLNGKRRFLWGGDYASVLTMEDDQLQSHEHTLNDPGHSHTYTEPILIRLEIILRLALAVGSAMIIPILAD